MPNIPINQPGLSSCGVYSGQLVAQPFFACGEKDGKAAAKFVALQFAFSTYPGWLIDTSSSGTPHPPIHKLAAVYVDAVDCQNDITLLVADNGYRVRIVAGNRQMVPIVSSIKNPKIYILSDNNGATSTDIVNIFLLDTIVPDFATNEFIRAISYGYGQFFVPQPIFAQSTFFSYKGDFLAGGTPQILIPNTLWYITSISLSIVVEATVTNTITEIGLYVNNTSPVYMYRLPVSTSTANVFELEMILEESNLQLTNQGAANLSGPLHIEYTNLQGGNNYNLLEYWCNIGGGILET